MDNKERLGEYLRRVRTSKRITLVEAEDRLHIRKSYLEAIELGDYEKIPNEVYVRGFLRSYSRFLGISPEKILARYDEEKRAREEEQDEIGQEEPRRASNSSGNRSWLARGAIGIVCLLVVVGLGIWQGPNAIHYINSKINGHTVGAIRVEATANKHVWLQVWVDGEIKAEGFYVSGDKQEWQGKNQIQVIAGDGSAVSLHVNGVSQGNMAKTDGKTHLVFKAP